MASSARVEAVLLEETGSKGQHSSGDIQLRLALLNADPLPACPCLRLCGSGRSFAAFVSPCPSSSEQLPCPELVQLCALHRSAISALIGNGNWIWERSGSSAEGCSGECRSLHLPAASCAGGTAGRGQCQPLAWSHVSLEMRSQLRQSLLQGCLINKMQVTLLLPTVSSPPHSPMLASSENRTWIAQNSPRGRREIANAERNARCCCIAQQRIISPLS